MLSEIGESAPLVTEYEPPLAVQEAEPVEADEDGWVIGERPDDSVAEWFREGEVIADGEADDMVAP